MTINADGSNPDMLTGNLFDTIDYHHPRWSPDGSKLALAIHSNMYNLTIPNESEIAIMNPDGSGITRLIAGAVPWSRTSWMSDGQHIVYTVLSGKRQDLAWVSADGTKSGTIITNGWNADVRH